MPPGWSKGVWRSGDPVPPGFRAVRRSNLALVVGGSVTLAASYATTLAFGLANSHRGGAYAAVPIAGPFSAMLAADNACSPQRCPDKPSYQIALGFLALAQLTGIAVLVPGVVMHREKLVPRQAFTLAPFSLAGRSGSGLALAGTF
jgi:hypothetical protein